MSSSNQNIRVFARFRPQFAHETEKGGTPCAEILNKDSVVVEQNHQSGPGRKAQFTFDRVFGPDSTQKDVYEETVGHMVDSVLRGYNCTVLAYGQTGSGKTYTMQGSSQSRGIMPRLMRSLYEKMEDNQEDLVFDVYISYVEVYLGRIRDLLEKNPIKRKTQKLKIKHDLTKGSSGVYLDGVVTKWCGSPEEIEDWLKFGAGHREIAKTEMNAESSRSHAVVIVMVKSHTPNGSTKCAKLMMVDLAGSEAAKKTGATGDTLEQAKAINGDLSALGRVMNQLTSGKGRPSYRDSKLTHLLSESLGGNCKTTMIVCASESSYNAVETVSTLRFGRSAKKVKNKAKVNQEKSVKEYKEEIAQLKKKVSSQKSIIRALKSDLNRALAGKITDVNECMYKRIEKGEKVVLEKDKEAEDKEHRRSPSNQSLDSNASADSKTSNSASESGATQGTVGHQRNLTNTSLASLGENELIVSKDKYDEFCEALERLGKVRSDFTDLQTKLVDKQAEFDAIELKMEKEAKLWKEQKISLRYKNEAMERRNDDLRNRLRLSTNNFETIIATMERDHTEKLTEARTEEQARVEKFIEEARDAIASDTRLSGNPQAYLASNEQRVKYLSSENSQLRQAFQDRNNEYVEWKMKAFKLEQLGDNLRRKVHYQNNELRLLAEAKRGASDIHYQTLSRLEQELKVKRKENADLMKKVVYLESMNNEDATWINDTHAVRSQFANMHMRIRPKKFREENILEQDIPQFPHGRQPSNLFTPMYTPDPTHYYRQASMDFSHNMYAPQQQYQTPQGPFQGFERFQNPKQNLPPQYR